MASGKFKGYMLAALAAAAYGTNPAFALPLYDQGMNPNTVLLFRYLFGLPILAAIMRGRGLSFSLRRGDLWITALLGVLMALSSLTLFVSYRYMNSGVASTLLFVYPIMVAVLMSLFFHERFRLTTGICLVVMGAGLLMLMKPQGGEPVSMSGCLSVMLSALTYAFYIILVNVSKRVRAIPTTKLLFYVLAWGCLLFAGMIPLGNEVTLPTRGYGWLNLLALAVIPTVLSLFCTTRAIQLIGSTPTAILGALEPVSAVLLSVTVLGQSMTMQDIFGGLLILAATTMVIADRQVETLLLHVRRMFPRHHRDA